MDPDLVVEVRPHGTSRVSHITDDLVAVDKLARMDDIHLHVPVAGADSVTVVQSHEVTESRAQLGHIDDAVGRGENGSPAVIGDVHPLVHLADFTRDGMDTRPEGRSIAALCRGNGGNVAPHRLVLVDIAGQGIERRAVVLEFAVQALGRFAHDGHLLENRGRLAQEHGIRGDVTARTQFAGFGIRNREAELGMEALFVFQKFGGSPGKVVEGPLDLGKVLVQLAAVRKHVMEHPVVDRSRRKLHQEQYQADHDDHPQNGPRLEQERRHKKRHGRRRVLDVYGRLVELHGLER